MVDTPAPRTEITLTKEDYKLAVRTYFMLGAAEALLGVLKGSTKKPDFDEHFKTDGYFNPESKFNTKPPEDLNGTSSKSNT